MRPEQCIVERRCQKAHFADSRQPPRLRDRPLASGRRGRSTAAVEFDSPEVGAFFQTGKSDLILIWRKPDFLARLIVILFQSHRRTWTWPKLQAKCR